ncbi:hypothetical protein F67_I3_11_032 [Rhizobium phage RHph_I3_11]|nr:hypothetical protein F67_I3_11_032 [Rhizobium phage RHph_I3_11]
MEEPAKINPDEEVFSLRGIAYILTMDDDRHFIRENQPCYGELRKYESTHKGECTQPNNPKPGDLKKPFPEGTPTSLIVPFGQYFREYFNSDPSEKTDTVFKALFSEDSPWVKGFGENWEFVKKGNYIYGVKFNTEKVDTTILVNSFKTMYGLMGKIGDFNELLDMGMTPNEVLCTLMLNGMTPKLGISQGDGYCVNANFSFKRFFNKQPNDLTGGYLSERVDYNRTNMADPFKADTRVTRWYDIFKGRLPIYGKRGYIAKDFPENFVNVVKDTIQEVMDKEPEPVQSKYIWKTTSGKTNEGSEG